MDLSMREKAAMNQALRNHLVLDCVFSSLGLTDLKAVRIVCSIWEIVSRKQVLKSSVGCLKASRDPENETMQRFKNVFPRPSLFPFDSYRFEGSFTSSDMEDFFDKRGKYIKELHLHGVNIKRNFNNPFRDIAYDLSNWNHLNLISLTIKGVGGTEFLIPLSFIQTIKRLSLRGCILFLNARIAPTKMRTKFTQFRRNRNENEQLGGNYHVNLNDFIDVVNLKELDLSLQFKPKFILNVEKCLHLEDLRLVEAEVTGWHENLTQLKRIDVGRVTVELSQLPSCVKDLNIYLEIPTNYIIFTRDETFPHVKSLGFRGDYDLLPQCPNVVRIRVLGNAFDLNQLSSQVTTLEINKMCVFTGLRKFKLETLIITNSLFGVEDWKRLYFMIERMRPNTVVLKCKCQCTTACCIKEGCSDGLRGLHLLLKIQMNNGVTFAIKQRQCSFSLKTSLQGYVSGSHALPFVVKLDTKYRLYKLGRWNDIKKEDYAAYFNE